jgi:hypothetical protein
MPSAKRLRPFLPATVGVAALAVIGCVDVPGEERFVPVADVQEVMLHIVEPAAQEYWGAVGWILDFEGEHYIHPQSEEEWLEVENAAFMVAEAGNLLMIRERALDDGGWMAMAQALVEVGRRSLEVAEARDEQGVFDLGAEMYAVCSACHAAYSPEILRPSDERSVAEGEVPGG